MSAVQLAVPGPPEHNPSQHISTPTRTPGEHLVNSTPGPAGGSEMGSLALALALAVEHEGANTGASASTTLGPLGAPEFDDMLRMHLYATGCCSPENSTLFLEPLSSSLPFYNNPSFFLLPLRKNIITNTNFNNNNHHRQTRSTYLCLEDGLTSSSPTPAFSDTYSNLNTADPLPLDTFFDWTSSSSFDSDAGSIDVTSSSTSSGNSVTSNTNGWCRVTNMPTSTISAPDGVGASVVDATSNPSYLTYMPTNVAGNISQWRPHSARSARSASPLLNRWTRKHQHHESKDKDKDKDAARKSSSSSISNWRLGTGDRDRAATSPSLGEPMPPSLTPEEFEALPLAIQRKYFSTLERLRFAQGSGMVDGIYHHYDDISSHNLKRRRPRQDRSASDHFARRIRRRSLRETQPTSPISPLFSSIPDKIKKRQFTREEQVVLARQLRASVILDAADEAVYKIGRRASKVWSPDIETSTTPALSSKRGSMETDHSERRELQPSNNENKENDRGSFYDSFRWLDEEEDLDLRLFLDDYHANLREDLPSPTKQRRPSFRRHLSITKLPFGRSSISVSRPATKETMSPTSPLQSPGATSPQFAQFGHGRRRSRTMSLITPRHTPQDSISAIDPSAAHYQDPEARLKLRVYLASPQKFDEAIEFGFPSAEVVSAAPTTNKSAPSPGKRQSRRHMSEDDHLRTFLADDDDDDKESVNSDQVSIPDPDSPKTPQLENKPTMRPMRVPADPLHMRGPSESYAQVPASSREMTLRMTLTRPDLRAHEDQIYGWQAKGGFSQPSRLSVTSPLREDSASPVQFVGQSSKPKESIEQVFAGIDHWGPETGDRGVMKRIWNRVRRA